MPLLTTFCGKKDDCAFSKKIIANNTFEINFYEQETIF